MAHARKPKPQTKQQKQQLKQKSKAAASAASIVSTASAAGAANDAASIAPPPPPDVRRLAHVMGQKIQVQTNNAGLAKTANRPSVFLPLPLALKKSGSKDPAAALFERRARKVTASTLAPSLEVPALDEFMDEFGRLWDEHIEGFGSTGKKRERTEMELNMEWRERIKTKQEKQSKAKKVVVVARKSGQTVSEQDRLLAIQKYREMQENKRKQPRV